MEDVKIEVLSSELKSLATKVDTGFSDIKILFNNSREDLKEHSKENDLKFDKLQEDIQELKLDMTRFKERWVLIGATVSLVGAAIIELIMHAVIK